MSTAAMQSNVTNGQHVYGPESESESIRTSVWTFIDTSDYDVANQQFVNVIMFNDLKFLWLKLFHWSITVQVSLMWVPQENLSWYSVLSAFHKVTCAIKCWLYDDFSYQNLLILSQDC